MSEKPLSIAIAGLGTVGMGVLKIIETNSTLINQKSGKSIFVQAVSARNKRKKREVNLCQFDWEDDPVSLARREDIDLIIEVMGGADGPAKALVETALKNGKHIVTANKAMLAEHGHELALAAEKNNVALRFEAAVAGGIPVIKALMEGLTANKITKITCVINGTCNYILTRMEEETASYEQIFSGAQALGYVEADPSLDVGGIDAAQKLSILSAIAFGSKLDFNSIEIEGIEKISLVDIENAKSMGYRIKLLGVSLLTESGVCQVMQPCLVPQLSPIAQLQGGTNMILLEGNFVGQTCFSGAGAGQGPTASAIVADVIDIARNNITPVFGIPANKLSNSKPIKKVVDSCYYLRFSLVDRPGVLGKVAAILGDHNISVDRMEQTDHDSSEAPLLIVTHKSKRVDLDLALSKIKNLDVCLSDPIAIKIEEI